MSGYDTILAVSYTLHVTESIIYPFARNYVCVMYVYRFLKLQLTFYPLYTKLTRVTIITLNHNMHATNNPYDESSCLQ